MAALAVEWRLKTEHGIEHDHLSDLAFLISELEFTEAKLAKLAGATLEAASPKKCFDCERHVDDVRYDLCSKCDAPSKTASLRAQIEQLPRYDMVTNYRCGESIDELEKADDGEWVRVETVLALLDATETTP